MAKQKDNPAESAADRVAAIGDLEHRVAVLEHALLTRLNVDLRSIHEELGERADAP